MDEKIRFCTLSRASLWDELSQDDLDYLKESGVTIMPHNDDDLGYSFQATDKQFLGIIDHFGKVVVDDDEITIYDDYLE